MALQADEPFGVDGAGPAPVAGDSPGHGGPARVVHVSVIHTPFDTRIHHKQCRTLAEAGYEVHLLTGGVGPGDVDGFSLHPISADPRRPPLRRQPHRQLNSRREARALDADLYHLHDPHLIPLGLELKRRGARVIYDVHEHYMDKARARLARRPLRREVKVAAFRLLEEAARRSFDGFVCASDALAARFPSDRTITVNNFPLLREFADPIGRSPEDPPVILYLGGMKLDRGFESMIEIPGHLSREHGARLRLVGELRPPTLAEMVAERPWADRIELVPRVPRKDALAQLSRATIGITTEPPRLNGAEGWRMNKLFEYMAAGLPVVIPDAPRWRDIVERYGCGVAADVDDPAAVAGAVERLLASPEWAAKLGENGRRAVLTELNWERQAPRLLALYERLLGRPAPAAVPDLRSLRLFGLRPRPRSAPGTLPSAGPTPRF